MNNAATTITVVMGAFTFLLSCLVGLLTYLWHQSNVQRDREVTELREMLRVNGKHLDSLVHTVWLLNWRMNGVEDYLSDTNNFRPPRIIGETEIMRENPT